ncbi:carbonic anhydrase [Lasiosphaeria hispida]|uniref:Carbonic anhydrase n=1 Tax=Lasiosphaeria hispida TaxID=260671 RepID=A0AAJ0HG89_9PEZI|nr:carbonic anhydrase [Lasiosphaeria hispida]
MATTIADLLERNRATSASHDAIPTFVELKAAGAPLPKTLVVTCLDPRCIPEEFFKLHVGEVLVHRNAGGNIRHALRDLLLLDEIFSLNELAIVHHTDCGTLVFTEEKMRAGIKARLDKAHWPDVDNIVFGANTDMEESVRSDVEWVHANPLIRKELKQGCQGFMFDLVSGKVEKHHFDNCPELEKKVKHIQDLVSGNDPGAQQCKHEYCELLLELLGLGIDLSKIKHFPWSDDYTKQIAQCLPDDPLVEGELHPRHFIFGKHTAADPPVDPAWSKVPEDNHTVGKMTPINTVIWLLNNGKLNGARWTSAVTIRDERREHVVKRGIRNQLVKTPPECNRPFGVSLPYDIKGQITDGKPIDEDLDLFRICP